MSTFKAIPLLAVALMLQACAGVRTIKQATLETEALKESIEFDQIEDDGRKDGKGYVPRLSAMGSPPKKVALVSFYVIDEPEKTGSARSGSSSFALTEESMTAVANELYKLSIGPLKTNFKANGMELLEPKDFLNTPEKKAFYDEFKIKTGAASNIVGSVMSFLKKDNGTIDTARVAANGYKAIFVQNGAFTRINKTTPDDKVTNSLGDELAKAMGVDAVVLVWASTKVNDKAVYLKDTNVYMFGPNPLPFKTEDLGYFGARSGHFYCGTHVEYKNVLLPAGLKIAALDAKGMFTAPGDGANRVRDLASEAPNADGYEGYEKIADALSSKLATFMTEATKKKD